MAKRAPDSEMDGAVYHGLGTSAKPSHFMSDPATGLRPGCAGKPFGSVKIFIDDGIDGKNLPPRSVWNKGEWKGLEPSNDLTWRTWVCSGEGSPGNYETREYIVPLEIAGDQAPKHPSDWPKKFKDSKKKSWTPKAYAPALPYGIRFRCIGCGHWYTEGELAGHVKNCCPASGETDWAIACECCKSLDETATVKKGFPRPPKMATPSDTSENTEGGDNGSSRAAAGTESARA